MLIDISRVGEAIPTSQKLEQGGQVITDAAKDAIFAEHFVGLLKLMSPDLSQPIVFYGQGREDWQAANAALRASKMGYTQVIWYRGGLDAWKAARLPVASVVLRGVAA